jgi:SnoaL-like protein
MRMRWACARVLPLAALLVAASACTRVSDADRLAAQCLADREEIEATLQRYLHGLDRLDAELYASSFAPDGEMIITGERHQGRDAMRAIVAAEAALRQSTKERREPPRTLFHFETSRASSFQRPTGRCTALTGLR